MKNIKTIMVSILLMVTSLGAYGAEEANDTRFLVDLAPGSTISLFAPLELQPNAYDTIYQNGKRVALWKNLDSSEDWCVFHMRKKTSAYRSALPAGHIVFSPPRNTDRFARTVTMTIDDPNSEIVSIEVHSSGGAANVESLKSAVSQTTLLLYSGSIPDLSSMRPESPSSIEGEYASLKSDDATKAGIASPISATIPSLTGIRR